MMRKSDLFTEAELRMLLGNDGEEDGEGRAGLASDDRKLLHALVRNQLRQLHMIEELQSEIRMMRRAMESGQGVQDTAASLGLDPLPFMRTPAAHSSAPLESNSPGDKEPQEAPPTRKERFKRRSLW